MGALTREAFLKLSWPEQKAADLRKVFDPEADVDLTANCLAVAHQDDSASMVIYSNGVYCFGCKSRWWPDQFLAQLGNWPLDFERGARKQPAPKYIPFGQVETYSIWLTNSLAHVGHYNGRMKWLLDRGLVRDTLVTNYIGHSGEAFTIPIFGEDRTVKAIRYRRDDELASEDRPKYWGTPGANDAMLYIPRWRTDPAGKRAWWDSGLILCEGELDALRLAQEGCPAISLTNGCNALKAEHVPQIRALARGIGIDRVVICYDQDGPGQLAAESAYDKLNAEGLTARIMWWPRGMGKDVTEYLLASGSTVAFQGRLTMLQWP